MFLVGMWFSRRGTLLLEWDDLIFFYVNWIYFFNRFQVHFWILAKSQSEIIKNNSYHFILVEFFLCPWKKVILASCILRLPLDCWLLPTNRSSRDVLFSETFSSLTLEVVSDIMQPIFIYTTIIPGNRTKNKWLMVSGNKIKYMKSWKII